MDNKLVKLVQGKLRVPERVQVEQTKRVDFHIHIYGYQIDHYKVAFVLLSLWDPPLLY